MDDHRSGARGKRSADEQADADSTFHPDQEYTWGGKPGEDFGPIAPPPPARPARGPAGSEHVTAGRTSDVARTAQLSASPQAAPARPRRRLWRPTLTLLAVLVVLGGLVGTVLLVLSRQATDRQSTGAQLPGFASPAASPAVAASPAGAAAAAQPGPSPAVARAATATSGSASQPAASPAPTRSQAAAGALTPTPRSSPVVVPTVPGLIVPPGMRFPTNTPARIASPTRTPPPVPTPRPAAATTPLRADRSAYKVGEDATICAQATFGSAAQIQVLEPNGATRTLGEFQPPADRVCQTFRLEIPGIYVLTLTVKDAAGRELERHATVISASR